MNNFVGFNGRTFSSRAEERRFIQSHICVWEKLFGKCKEMSITTREGKPFCKPHAEQWDLNNFQIVGRHF